MQAGQSNLVGSLRTRARPIGRRSAVRTSRPGWRPASRGGSTRLSRDLHGSPWGRSESAGCPAYSGCQWLFKRDARVSLPLDQLGRTIDGIPYLRPSVVLLHKAKALRDKDQQDFEGMLPRLADGERVWLDESLAIAHRDHPWRARL
jgi:hypothetical protein